MPGARCYQTAMKALSLPKRSAPVVPKERRFAPSEGKMPSLRGNHLERSGS